MFESQINLIMKTIILSVTISFMAVFCYGQSGLEEMAISMDKTEYNAIWASFKAKDYLGTVEGLNKFIPGYSTYGQLYFMRGLAKLGLNDVFGARKDFQQAKWSGFKGEQEYVNLMISKEYCVKKLLRDLIEDVRLDSLRDFKPVIEPKDTMQGALRFERSCFDVYFYSLEVKLFPEKKRIEGCNRIFFKTIKETKVIQIDLFPEFTVTSVNWKGKELSYKRVLGALFIDFGETIPSGENEEIRIVYNGTPRIAPKPPWNGGFIWEKDKDKYHIGVACEHLGASSWWPNKDHLSDKPDSMKINLIVPSGYQGISNGNLISQRTLEDGYTDFEWFVSYPINNYNVTLYMGDFVNFNEELTNSDGTYKVDYYVLPKNLEKAKKYYSQTKDIFAVYEKLFGPYPFMKDGAAMVEAPFEGMEHQSAIAIGGDYGKSNNRRYWTRDYDYILIHESAHEWWGNSLAISDMADAWINEGFSTYAECLFAEEKGGYPAYLKAVASNNLKIFNIWPIVGERNINANTFIGGDIYNKGSAMLHNLRCIINNDSVFKNMIRDFYGTFRFKTCTTADFVNFVHDYTKVDYTDFFNVFLYRTDPPVLSCSYNMDGGDLVFTYRWTNVGKNFCMPLCVAVNSKEYIRLDGTSFLQTFRYKNAKIFYLPNEWRYEEKNVPLNSFTYYWTSWSL
jgi:aminopeptidase N